MQPMIYAHAAIFAVSRLSYRIWSLARRHLENPCGRYSRIVLPFSKVQLALNRFSRNARLLDTVKYRTGVPNFMKRGQTNIFLKLSDRRTDVVYTYIVNISLCIVRLKHKGFIWC